MARQLHHSTLLSVRLRQVGTEKLTQLDSSTEQHMNKKSEKHLYSITDRSTGVVESAAVGSENLSLDVMKQGLTEFVPVFRFGHRECQRRIGLQQLICLICL